MRSCARGINLSVDESLLTGESVPVRKAASANPPRSSIFRGATTCLPCSPARWSRPGRAWPKSSPPGSTRSWGRSARPSSRWSPKRPSSRRKPAGWCGSSPWSDSSPALVVVVVYALTRGGSLAAWKDGLLAGIALAMATLPEEFPVVLTIFLALGAWRISRSHVLTRRMPAVETLGAATVLCVDKTGTLTLNRMTLKQVTVAGAFLDLATFQGELPEPVHDLMEYAILASRKDPFDPMERALHAAGRRWLVQTEHLHPAWSLAQGISPAPGAAGRHPRLDHGGGRDHRRDQGGPGGRGRSLPPLRGTTRQSVGGGRRAGRPRGCECSAWPGGATSRRRCRRTTTTWSWSSSGCSVWKIPCGPPCLPRSRNAGPAGIRVVMITGDYPVTAQSIARQAGLEHPEKVITGPELDRLTDEELAERIRDVHVFARVVPEQKLRIVNALKANREVVAMTGDGVNDAPALKAAHIGIAMGGRGTDVAREAASLVLLDDDFSSIVAAIRLGRRIFDNIRKAIAFILAVHVPIAGLSLLPVFFPGWPLLLLPVHIVFLELVIDPSCSLVFEAEEAEADVMQRPPAQPGRTVVQPALHGPGDPAGPQRPGRLRRQCTSSRGRRTPSTSPGPSPSRRWWWPSWRSS